MAMVTEDRHLEGLVLDRSVKFNISLANLKRIRRNGLTDGKKETDMAKQGVEELNIKSLRSIVQSNSSPGESAEGCHIQMAAYQAGSAAA